MQDVCNCTWTCNLQDSQTSRPHWTILYCVKICIFHLLFHLEYCWMDWYIVLLKRSSNIDYPFAQLHKEVKKQTGYKQHMMCTHCTPLLTCTDSTLNNVAYMSVHVHKFQYWSVTHFANRTHVWVWAVLHLMWTFTCVHMYVYKFYMSWIYVCTQYTLLFVQWMEKHPLVVTCIASQLGSIFIWKILNLYLILTTPIEMLLHQLDTLN